METTYVLKISFEDQVKNLQNWPKQSSIFVDHWLLNIIQEILAKCGKKLSPSRIHEKQNAMNYT